MYIKKVEFTNLRCFKHGAMEFRYPGDGITVPDGVPKLENVNLILGVNGAGKTTALKAVALSLMAQLPSTGFVPDSLVRLNKRLNHGEIPKFNFGQANISTNINLSETDEQNISDSLLFTKLEATIERINGTEELSPGTLPRSEIFYEDKSPAFFMVAYGATRRTETGDFAPSSRRKLRSARYERVSGLFEDHVAMTPVNRWAFDYSDTEFSEFSIFDELLPNHLSLESISDSGLDFRENDITISFSALSDGFRSYIGWITDLIYHMMDVTNGQNIKSLKGTVMVDEIDLHVHPSWQKTIIEQVARALPNLQFIFTTHSPIVAGSVSSKNLWIAKTAEDGSSILERPSREIYGLNADQILTSDIFGLQSTRAEGFLKELDKLEQKAIRGDEDAALALMRGMALGKGAVEPKEPPAWVKQAAKKSRKKS
jgi:AAA domain, putative AbiEii toxin, Type IV TA system